MILVVHPLQRILEEFDILIGLPEQLTEHLLPLSRLAPSTHNDTIPARSSSQGLGRFSSQPEHGYKRWSQEVSMDDEPSQWQFVYATGRYVYQLNDYTAQVWPRVAGKRWVGSVGNKRHAATAHGFTSLEEAQLWCEEQMTGFIGQDGIKHS